jgi:hypothetical protein
MIEGDISVNFLGKQALMTAQQNRDALFQQAALTLLLSGYPYTQSELATVVNAQLGKREDAGWQAAIRSPDGIARVFRGALTLLLATKNERRLARAERVVSCLEDDDYVTVATARPGGGGIRYQFAITAEGRQHLALLKSQVAQVPQTAARPVPAVSHGQFSPQR